MNRAKILVAAGDISPARLLLERAAEAQEPTAALMLARTYDPDVLRTENVGFDEGLFEGEGITIAARDIQPGEEILCDYRSFDADARDGEI